MSIMFERQANGTYTQVDDPPKLADMVAVVRCKDCKHMHRVRSWLGMDVDECWLHADRESGEIGKARTEPDGFCAWGERRVDA